MIELDVPFSEKDRAKQIAKENGTSIRWEPDEKYWYYPGNTLPAFLKEFEKNPEPTQEEEQKGPRVLAIDYTYLPFARAAGAKWNQELKVCTFEGTTLPVELTGFDPLPYSWEAWAQEELSGKRASSPKRKNEKTLVPRDDQKEAITAIHKAKRAKSPGFLLADEVGLGKTISAWQSILEMEPNREKKIAIICPLGVIAGWRSTIEKMGEGKNRILLINYDKLKKVYDLEKGVKPKSLKGVAKRGKPLKFDIVILDESHKIKNPTAARSKLAMGLYKQTDFLIWMSATAGQNVLELAYLSPILSYRTGDKITEISKDFEEWCKKHGAGLTRGEYGKWKLDESPESNAMIHDLLFKPKNGVIVGIRRRPQDIQGWPEIQRIPYPVELDHNQRELYQLAWDEFLEAIKSGKETPAGRKNPLKSVQGIAGLTRLRQKASILKIEQTCELALELLANGKQVAISCQYLNPVEKILERMKKEKVSATRFTGNETPKEKEENRLRYQKGECKVIVFTVEEGINLHAGEFNDAPRAQIDHDPRWSAIAAQQIDGRSHRNGTFAPAYWICLKDTIEERIISKLMERMMSMGEIHGDESESLELLKAEILRQ